MFSRRNMNIINFSRDKLIDSLNKAAYYSKGTKITRIMKLSPRIFFAIFIEYIARLTHAFFYVKAKTFWHEDMNIVIPEAVSINIGRYGFFEEGLTSMFLEYLKPEMTFLDVGAHFGYFTLLGSKLVGEEGSVHSFEPTQSSFAILKKNVQNKRNVTLNNSAVFSKKASVCVNDYGIKYGSFNSIYEAKLPEKTKKHIKSNRYIIDAVSIDEYVKNTNIKPDFIKIDAESAEMDIIMGAQNTIEKFHPIISVEVGDMYTKNTIKSKDIIKFLMQYNYSPYEYRDGKIIQHKLEGGQYAYDNILFLKNK